MSWLTRLLGRRSRRHGDGAAPGPIPVTEASGADIAHQFEQGVADFAAKRYAAAKRCFEAVVEKRHDHAEAHHWLGLTYLECGALDEAADSLLLATHFRPVFPQAWYNLALIARRRKDRREAVRCLEQALASNPDYADAHNALGALRLEKGDVGAAIESFERAIACDPANARARSNLGYVLLRERAEYGRGVALIRAALELAPQDPDVWCNYCLVLSHEGRLDETIAVCDRLLAANAGLDEVRLNRALTALKLGRFDEGWPDYEARKRVRSNYVPRPYAFPEWRGESLASKTILVYGEQGIGDEIMFASCLRDLLGAAQHCIVDCSPRLAPLFRRSFPGTTVQDVEQSEPHPQWPANAGPIHYQVASGSLPGFFRRRAADFPAHAGYLRPEPSRVDYWRERLAAIGPGRKIGIAWRGGMDSTRRSLRSIPLTQWLPLLRQPGPVFVSLQYGDCDAEIDALEKATGCVVHHWPQAAGDLDEVAALICALDLVVSVQTATVHLAGALGRPAWVLVPAVAEWRYLAQGAAMPWYPSVRMFRQPADANWSPVMAAVAARIAQHAPAGDWGQVDTEGDAAPSAAPEAVDLASEVQQLAKEGRLVAAQSRVGAARLRWPGDANLANTEGNIRRLAGNVADAEQAYREALACDPGHAAAAANLGWCLFERGALPAAEAVLSGLLAREPGHAEALFDLARVRIEQGDDAAGLALLDRALAQDPGYADAHVQRGLLLLKRGDYAEGWPEYAWRERAEDWREPPVDPARRWNGESRPEATLLVRAEQGIGDQIMFASCLAEARARVGHLIFQCDPRLIPLIARSIPQVETVPWVVGAPPAATRAACEIFAGSLPGLLRRHAADFPQRTAYLMADAGRVQHWRQALDAAGARPALGIAWRAGTPTTRGGQRSLPLALLAAALAESGGTLVSLQHDGGEDELGAAEAATGVRILRWPEVARNPDETAALMTALDAVITVCGTPLHLAGALGVPALALVPRVAEWRYGADGSQMPWYPGVRLLRQTAAQDWSTPLGTLRVELPTLVRGSR
jgi:tetratricopeptide (TPR) repeat protein